MSLPENGVNVCAGRGRGSRSAALLQAFQEQTRANQEQTSVNGGGGPTTNGVNGKVVLSPPSGRGAALAALMRQQDNPPLGRGRVTPATGEEPPMSMGRGRAALLQQSRIREIQDQNQQQIFRDGNPDIQSPPATPRPTSHNTPPSEAMTQALDQLKIKEQRSPVIQHGQAGKQICLTANYVKLLLEPGRGVYEYEVRFTPDVDSRDARFKLLNEMRSIIGTTKTFDGVTLYLPMELKREDTFFNTVHQTAGTPVQIEVRFRCRKKMADCIHLYNVLLKRIMSELKLARLGRQHFDPSASKIIPQYKLEIWPGYVTAVDEFEGGILLCCDSSSRVLRTQTCLEVIYELTQTHRNNWQEELKNQILGTSVLTRYNNRLYRVDEVDFTMSPMSTFPVHSGGEISFMEYYEKQYGLQIRDEMQPMLQSRIRKKMKGMEDVEQLVVLVPELCYLTGITDKMKNDFRVMKDIATYTRITPNQRHYALKKYLESVANSEKATKMLSDWGLKLAPDTVELEGRVTDQEIVYFGGTSQWNPDSRADWTKEMSRSKVLHAVDLHVWAVLYTNRDSRNAEEFRSIMLRTGPPMGIKMMDPQMISLRDDRTDTYLRALRDVVSPELQLVVIIFPTSRDDRYAAVKRFCCVDSPIPSQVINSKTLGRQDKVRGIVQKIALQINCKVGGSLWSISNPFKTSMIIGIDTYHDSVSKKNSVGGFVASLNPTLTRWYSRVCIQNANQELIQGLKLCFVDALLRFNTINNKFPDRVIVFRDGVGDGQLKSVLSLEVEQFQSCFKEVAPNFDPKFTVVIVQKRINTRLFSVQNNGNLDNPPPGTVMDHTVTRKFLYDFFLVSQSVKQGTVSPTHYIVLFDNSNIKPDHIQRFAYKLCHMYYNWSGTIRVPAPCQYAHRVAQLVGMHIRRVPHPDLVERLYFL